MLLELHREVVVQPSADARHRIPAAAMEVAVGDEARFLVGFERQRQPAFRCSSIDSCRHASHLLELQAALELRDSADPVLVILAQGGWETAHRLVRHGT